MTLKKYQQKRNFTQTPEPKGKVAASKKKLKLSYLIQKHAASHLHYDFRLELNGVLLSWAVPKGPCLDPDVKRLAMHVEDHPLEYGKFEGIIPKGQYGGGTVMLWDTGVWVPKDDNVMQAYKKGDLKFSLVGKRLQGDWKLIRINQDDKTWLLIKAKDEYSKKLNEQDILADEKTSVTTNRTMEEIATNFKKIWSGKAKEKNQSAAEKINLTLPVSKFPTKILPQLATLVDKPPEGNNWLHEMKLDGCRILAFKKNSQIQLMTRNGNGWTEKFKSIATAVKNLAIKNVVLDGEIVILNENQKSDFQALQNSLKDGDDTRFIYYVFDILYADKYNLMELSLLERKEVLHNVIGDISDVIRYSDHIVGSGEKILSKACELSLEGIVSKNATSTYVEGRTKSWLKIKCIKRQEFVVGGFTKPKNARPHFGSLLIGTYDKEGELVYNGHVGTGFTMQSLAMLHELFTRYHTDINPFNTKPPKMKDITWVKPKIIVEVEFTEWTTDNILRHPSFKGIRTDKKPKIVKKELPLNVSKLIKKNKLSSSYNLSHPDKVLYKEDSYTKLMLAEYYDNIHKWILPYIINRPLTLVRCPEGYEKCFYQKHITDSLSDDLFSIEIKEKEAISEAIYIKNKAGLLILPQLGVLEIHPWGSLIKDIEKPDIIVFDVDPDVDLPWKKVVKCALDIKHHLAEFQLKSFIKTTGGKGLHVVVPIKPESNWDEVKIFSHTFVNFLIMNNPKDYLSKMNKTERKGKIFIDYLRNQRGATAVAPYSTRARIHAPVATPIEWDELTSKFEDTFFNIGTVQQRLSKLKKDPWADFYKIKQSLNLYKYK